MVTSNFALCPSVFLWAAVLQQQKWIPLFGALLLLLVYTNSIGDFIHREGPKQKLEENVPNSVPRAIQKAAHALGKPI